MSLSLYDATIPSFLQILGSALGWIEKAQAHCAEKGISDQELLATHFGEDMLPLANQLKWISTHSIGAISAAGAGLFQPDPSSPPESFAAASTQINASIASLKAIAPEEINRLVDANVRFSSPARGIELDFTGANFLLSFSLPNFYFHASTAYDLLRDQGVALGKRDFLGALRIKIPA